MTNKNELNQEELDKVTGGAKPFDNDVYTVGRQLDQYETEQYIGSEVVVVNGPKAAAVVLAYGTLMSSFEDSWGCGTRRRCDIKLHPGSETTQYTTSEGYAICYVDKSPIYLIEYK